MSSPPIPSVAVLVGAAALIPLPFVDELVRRFLLKMCFEELAVTAGRPLESGQGWALARQRSNLVLGCLIAVFWWPIKKIFRMMLFVLIAKDVIDWAADAVIRAALVRRALERGALPGDTAAVWSALDKAADDHFKSPAIRVLLDAKSPPPEAWMAEGGSTEAMFAWLARWGRGHAALLAFDASLDELGFSRDVPADRLLIAAPVAAEE